MKKILITRETHKKRYSCREILVKQILAKRDNHEKRY